MIALDIGTKNIKLCKVEQKSEEFYDVSASMVEIPDGMDDKTRKKYISKQIKTMLIDKKFKAEQVATSLGSTDLLIRNLELPQMPREELKNTIKLQGERLIYSDLNDMDIDFYTVPSHAKNKMDVVFVAAPSIIVDRKMDIVQRAGVQPAIMDIDNLAIANTFLNFYPDKKKSVILLDIGYTNSCFTILNRGKFCFSKTVKFGGKNIVAEIMRELEISNTKAELIMKDPSNWTENGINMTGVLRKSSPDLLEAIYKSIEYSKNQNMILDIDQMFVTGGISNLTGIDNFFHDILGLETKCWNPMEDIKLLKDKSVGMFHAVSLGLALRQLKDV